MNVQAFLIHVSMTTLGTHIDTPIPIIITTYIVILYLAF